MNKRGYAIVFDCILGFVIIVVFLSTLRAPEMSPYTEVVIAQKAHDLLTVWQAKKNFAIEEMRKDFVATFWEKSGRITVGENTLTIGIAGEKRAFSFETFFLDENLKPIRLVLTVFD